MTFGCNPFPSSQFGAITITGLTSGGAISPDANGNFNLGGSNVAVIGNPATNTLSFIAPNATGIAWMDITTSPIQTLANRGYIDHFSGATQYTLPLTSALGDVLLIVTAGEENNGWRLNLGSNQEVFIGADQSTPGGTVTSRIRGDTLYLVCTLANTRWLALSFVGDFVVT